MTNQKHVSMDDLFDGLALAARAVIGWDRWQIARAWRARIDRARALGFESKACDELDALLVRDGYLAPRKAKVLS